MSKKKKVDERRRAQRQLHRPKLVPWAQIGLIMPTTELVKGQD